MVILANQYATLRGIGLICRFPNLGLRNYLRDNTCLISAEVSFDDAFVNSELPHRSVTSDNDSKLRITAI